MLEINTLLISKWLSERPYIWQMDLLSDNQLMEFSRKRGVDFGRTDSDIKRFRKLWKLGFIKADLIKSKTELSEEGLVFLAKDFWGYSLYADERKMLDNPQSIADILTDVETPQADIELFFHPFRIFVLHKIIEESEPFSIDPLLIYSSKDNYKRTLDSRLERLEKPIQSNKYENWNKVVSLVVASEPITFRKIFGVYRITFRYPFERNDENEKRFYDSLEVHKAEFKELIKDITEEQIKEIISEILLQFLWVEPNTDVLTLLRLTKGRYRLEKIEGNLGLATYLLAMVEMIRRSYEISLNTLLPEEDEFNFGGDRRFFKEYYYGTPRLLDKPTAKGLFIRDLGLDYNIRLRWYVEGQTEFEALQSFFGESNISVEIINLKGEIVAGKGKGLAFKENLLNDINRTVYSWVSLDKDLSENCRVVIKAAENREMFGSYFFAEPDFEFENFTLDELVEIAWSIAAENGADPKERIKLVEATKTVSKGADFEKAVRNSIPLLNTFGKGKEWGERLMKFANANRKMQMKDGNFKMRQVCEAITLAHQALGCSYYLSQKNCQVDLTTGILVNNKITL